MAFASLLAREGKHTRAHTHTHMPNLFCELRPSLSSILSIFQASGWKEQSEENSSNNKKKFVFLFVCLLLACFVFGGERRMWVAMARTRAAGVLWAFLVVLLLCLLTSPVHVMGKLDPHYVNNGDLSFPFLLLLNFVPSKFLLLLLLLLLVVEN